MIYNLQSTFPYILVWYTSWSLLVSISGQRLDGKTSSFPSNNMAKALYGSELFVANWSSVLFLLCFKRLFFFFLDVWLAVYMFHVYTCVYVFNEMLYFSLSLILGGSSPYSLALRNVDIWEKNKSVYSSELKKKQKTSASMHSVLLGLLSLLPERWTLCLLLVKHPHISWLTFLHPCSS